MNVDRGLHTILAEFRPLPDDNRSPEIQKALFLARHLETRASFLKTLKERRQQARLNALVRNSGDKATLIRITDEAFRASDPRRGVEHLQFILGQHGEPGFLTGLERLQMKAFRLLGKTIPALALRVAKNRIRKDAAEVILPGERRLLSTRLAERARDGVRMNVNFLGEAILSEAEAERRLGLYCQSLFRPEIEVVSIKISTLYSQISPVARDETIARLCNRLERLIRTAADARFQLPDGSKVPKFVYLDMEEYRDKSLTTEAFIRTLNRSSLFRAEAGIALQSYLPDSFGTLQHILQWARDRVSAGGGRITVRLVKGANLEMERLEATLHGWPQAPYKCKAETDANYKRMLQETLKRENLAAANVGIASHNLFDLAYGLVLAQAANALDRVQIEMLEGMANPHQRAIVELGVNVLLYAPACESRHFINAVGYLVRRLDENTGPENFLSNVFQSPVGSPEWQDQEGRFVRSLEIVPVLNNVPRRTQNRLMPAPETAAGGPAWQDLRNEPDTDFSLPENAGWARQIIFKWQPLMDERSPEIPLVIAGHELASDKPRHCFDPSRPGVRVGRFSEASEAQAAKAVECATLDPDGWRALSLQERSDLLGKVAQEIRTARADLVGAAIANAGKTVSEADPEVSEAVDFVEFYRKTVKWWSEMPGLVARPKGVVVVVSPWNFPIAIPCGGIAAALASGNTVIFKPSSDAVLVAWELCKCFWKGGIPRKALQFVPSSASSGARVLVKDPRISSVILTGGTATALAMLGTNPRLQLFAETGGKDATIVTSISDRDQAIRHILHSAFSHAGQKCSATSLLLLQGEVYDDPEFRRTLREAAQSLAVGSAWNLETKINPLIRPPSGDLDRALKVLDPGEEWSLVPHVSLDNPNLWSPGIKYGVRPGSFTHMTEFFGPVLGVMRFESLPEAVHLVNQTGYGLTSGLESLDEREWAYWKDHIRSGNLYINRSTTGAIVLRQPFGGHGRSVFGPGMKAGGPNYVVQLMDFKDAPDQSKREAPENTRLAELCRELCSAGHPDYKATCAAAASYESAAAEEFLREHDHFRLPGQDNLRRYLPLPEVWIRVEPADTPFDLLARVCAGIALGVRLHVSAAPDTHERELQLLRKVGASWGQSMHLRHQTEADFVTAVHCHKPERIRYASQNVPASLLQVAAKGDVTIVSGPVSAVGRLELLWYVREQSVSIDYHRYGNLGARAAEQRASPE